MLREKQLNGKIKTKKDAESVVFLYGRSIRGNAGIFVGIDPRFRDVPVAESRCARGRRASIIVLDLNPEMRK